MDLWQCDDHDPFWGSVGASGTEGNLWALYLAREALPDAALLYSADAHYSIPKAARILRIRREPLACHPDGRSTSMPSSTHSSGNGATAYRRPHLRYHHAGAHDDIAAVIAPSTRRHRPRRRHVHVDGALNAMVLPFVPDAPARPPTFRHHIDSISTSGQDRDTDALRRARHPPRPTSTRSHPPSPTCAPTTRP